MFSEDAHYEFLKRYYRAEFFRRKKWFHLGNKFILTIWQGWV